MNRIVEIARREYVETVKTRAFLLGLLMTPILMAGIVFFADRVHTDRPGPRPPKRIALTDLSGPLAQEAKAQFEAYNAAHSQQQIVLEIVPADAESADAVARKQKDLLGLGGLDAYVLVDGNVVGGGGRFVIYTGGAKPSDLDFLPAVESLLNRAVINLRCRASNLSPEVLAALNRRVPTEQVDVSAAGQKERRRDQADQVAVMLVPFAFMFLMFMGIFGTGQQMLTSIIEEKNSRVMEVLLSAVSPFELMAGKIVGLAGIGLTVVGVWCAAAVAAARWKGLELSISPEMVAYFVVYYVLGFLLFSAILAAVGSVCNTIKEAQSLMVPLSLLLVVPMMIWFHLVQHPDGTLARVV